VVPDAPEQVWRALTDPASLADWLMPNDFRPKVGHVFAFRPAEGKSIVCEVIEVEENVRLSYWWDDGESGAPSVVAWTLTPTEGGTRLQLEHQLLEPDPVVVLETRHNWRLAYASLPVQIALSRMPALRPPVIYVGVPEGEEEPRRLIGLREREVVA